MKNFKCIVLLILTFFSCLQGFCWGKEGDKIAAKIATRYLDQGTKDSLQVYLGGTTIPEAVEWMEEARSDRNYDYLKPFHFINIEKGETYDSASQNNIISELNKVISELKERNKYSKAQVALDLKILMHLVADLHTPLNVGYAVDRGGNNVRVNFLNRLSNLHNVWDVEIIAQYSIATVDCQNILDGYPVKEINKLKEVNIINWLNESRANLPAVYDFKNPYIDNNYCQKNKPLIEKELGLSGLRMAALLNQLFSK